MYNGVLILPILDGARITGFADDPGGGKAVDECDDTVRWLLAEVNGPTAD